MKHLIKLVLIVIVLLSVSVTRADIPKQFGALCLNKTFGLSTDKYTVGALQVSLTKTALWQQVPDLKGEPTFVCEEYLETGKHQVAFWISLYDDQRLFSNHTEGAHEQQILSTDYGSKISGQRTIRQLYTVNDANFAGWYEARLLFLSDGTSIALIFAANRDTILPILRDQYFDWFLGKIKFILPNGIKFSEVVISPPTPAATAPATQQRG